MTNPQSPNGQKDVNEDRFAPYYEELMDFNDKTDEEVVRFAYDRTIGLDRARAIQELARRALINQGLLGEACRAITSDHKMGVHYLPIGWAGAYLVFESGDKTAMQALLKEMQSWEPKHQQILLFHLGVLDSEETKSKFETKYDWKINFPPIASNG